MIDNHAIISKKAKIGAKVSVGPYTIIGDNVEIGEGTKIGSHVVIEGITKIGKHNQIFSFVSLGADPQDKKYRGESTFLEIGDNNVFREFSSVHRGTKQGHGFTKIGNDNLLMNYVHVAHDCIVGNENIFSNNAALAGHVTIGNYVNLSGFAKVAQFLTLGDYCFVGGNSDVIKDVLPYVVVVGTIGNMKAYGLNLIGLKRRGFSGKTLRVLKTAYDFILRENLSVEQALPKLEALVKECPQVQAFIDMLQKSAKGVVR